MILKALDEIGLKPDGTLKEGFENPSGVITGDSFKEGMLHLLKSVNSLSMMVL